MVTISSIIGRPIGAPADLSFSNSREVLNSPQIDIDQ